MLKKFGTPLLLLVMIAGLSLVAPFHAIGESAPAAPALQASPAPGTEDIQTTFTAYIHTIKGVNGTVYADVDPIGWYQGAAADKVYKEADPDGYAELGGTPDGYYIVNTSEDHITYPVKEDAKVLMQLYDRDGNPENADIVWNEPITLDKFVQVFQAGGLLDVSVFPYHITTDHGEIVKIVQQYVP